LLLISRNRLMLWLLRRWAHSCVEKRVVWTGRHWDLTPGGQFCHSCPDWLPFTKQVGWLSSSHL